MRKLSQSALAGVVAALLVNVSSGAIINVATAKTTSGHMSFTMDPLTGKYYERTNCFGNGATGATVRVFNNASDFESNVVATTITLGGEGFWGTYFTANNGKLFGRAGLVKSSGWPTDSSVRRWDASTGTLESTLTSIPGMGGLNGTHTFDWGGFSGVNWLQDATGIYVLGKNLSGNDWQLNRIDEGLNILETKTFAPLAAVSDNYGFAFMINGKLFLGTDYNAGNIVDVFDFATGTLTQENFVLTGQNGNYWSNTFYDPNSDTLYLNNVGNSPDTLFKVENASEQFGVGDAVPEPSTCAVFTGLILCFGLAGWWRRRRPAA